MCRVRCPFSLNVLPHSEQLNGFSLECTAMCPVRFCFSLNLLPHTEQLNGLSPECTAMCWVRLPFCVNLLPHSEQRNGLSPECMTMCPVRFCFSLNLLPHSEQLYGLSPECMAMCCVRLYFTLNLLPHSEQGNGFSLKWASSPTSSLFTGTGVKVTLVRSASSWLVQSSSCSSLMCGGSGSSWSRLELHSCCSGGTSSLLTDRWTSVGQRRQTDRCYIKTTGARLDHFGIIIDPQILLFCSCWLFPAGHLSSSPKIKEAYVPRERESDWQGDTGKHLERHHHDVYRHASSGAAAPAFCVNSQWFVFMAELLRSVWITIGGEMANRSCSFYASSPVWMELV